MDLLDVLRVLFWAWVIVSLVILIGRTLNKRTKRHPEHLDALSVDDPSSRGLRHTGAPGTTSSPPPSDAPRPVSGEMDGPASGAPKTAPDQSPPSGTSPAHGRPPATHRADAPPIAAMVTGIQLPCDLAPVIDYQRRDGVRESVAFLTRGHAAGTVGRAISDELTRLGFELDSLGTADVVATKDGATLNVTVIAEAGATERAGQPAFPGAGDGAVVVEFWT